MRLIGLFFPALISVSIKHSRNKELTWNLPNVLIEYGIYVLINVMITAMTVTYILSVHGVTIDALDSFPFFTKYVVIAIFAAVLVPYMEEIIKKYVRITFTVKTHEKEDEKHKEDY